MPGVTGARWEFARRDPVLAAEGAVRFLDEHDRGRRKACRVAEARDRIRELLASETYGNRVVTGTLGRELGP